MNFEKDCRVIRYRLKGDGIMRIFLTIVISMVVVFAVFVSSSLALPIYGDQGIEGLGSFTGDIAYDPDSATLKVTLTNTSPVDNGGYITGFAFNNPDDRITSVFLEDSDTSFHLIGDDSFNNSIKASPFGFFDIGASLDNKDKKNDKLDDLTGTGGKPTSGIAAGNTRIFSFHLEGIGLSLLTAESFINELSDSKKEPGFFAVRFKGFEDGGSDKVELVPGIPDLVIPEPSTILLLGVGLMGILGLTRKFSKR